VSARQPSTAALIPTRVSERAGAAIATKFQESRSGAKRRTIAQAATELFIAKGYPATSVDEIAEAARVSKQTVYKHFGSKENLFLAVTAAATDAILDELETLINPALGESENVEQDLLTFARRFAALVLRPELMALRRLVMTEAVHFPELGLTWYAHGPGRVIDQLARSFERLNERGLIAVDDAPLAAENFNWLLLSAPQNKILFGVVEKFTDDEIGQIAARAVQVFLAAYRPASGRGMFRKP
jgi:TetR/AcrR family transcriptional repressor of mexJK operon